MDLAAGLQRLSGDYGAGLAITASRRTGEENEARLRGGLAGTAWWFWDGQGDNPYLGLLALADAIVTTSPDVTVSTNLGPWVNQRGIFNRKD